MTDYQTALIEAAQDFHDHEMNVGGDARWERWNDKVVALLNLPIGPGLDGDEDEDGFCMDLAYDAFLAGVSAKDHAASIKAKPQFIGCRHDMLEA